MYCCNFFKNSIENAGKETFSILFEKTKERFLVKVQFRCFNYSENASFKISESSIKNFKTSGEFVLKYCPSCGTKLENIMKKNQKHFLSLAKKHSKYLIIEHL